MDWDELCVVAEGVRYAVVMTPAVEAALARAPAKDRARILRFMEIYARDGPTNLNDHQLKHEKKVRIGKEGRNVAVFAWRAYQVRVYGVQLRRGDKTFFVCTEMDIKKRNRANQKLLLSTAEKLVQIDDASKAKGRKPKGNG